MSTHLTRLLRLTRSGPSRRRPIEPAVPEPATTPSWSAGALQALARASAMGLMIPPSVFHTTRERRDVR